MDFVILTPQEFDSFTKSNFSHYTQSLNHYTYRKEVRNDVHIVGVKDEENNVIAACLLTESRSLKFFKYFYTHRGPVLDFNNITLVNFFFRGLTSYLKKHNCLFVLTDPYTLLSIRDADGQIKKRYDKNTLINTMKKMGYQYQGPTIGYSDKSQIRWLSVLNLKGKNTDQLLKEMDYQTRRNIKKTYEMDVKVRDLSIDETGEFFKLFRMAEEKHGFKFRDQQYFEEMQKIYGKNAMLKLAYINLSELLAKQEEKLKMLGDELQEIEKVLLENSNSKKSKVKLQSINQQITSQKKKIKQTKALIKTDGEIINLASALYLYNEHEVYYLSSGSNPKYNPYMGAYRLQWEMIKFAKENQIDRYNFYGVTGDFSDYAEDYGVQRFKEGFNADVEEYIGDFIKPIKPIFYKIYKLINH